MGKAVVDPSFKCCGEAAVLMDVAPGIFELATQQRLWSLAAEGSPLACLKGVLGVVLGVNNLLVMFDPEETTLEALQDELRSQWETSKGYQGATRLIEAPVHYDRSPGSELEGMANHAQMSVEEFIGLHTSVPYHVACIGSVPGFPYLVGLSPRLAVPRHSTPRPRIAKGSVAIGGSQTGVIPIDMPSGWHVLGKTQVEIFNPSWEKPCLLAPGDQIRFIDIKASA